MQMFNILWVLLAFLGLWQFQVSDSYCCTRNWTQALARKPPDSSSQAAHPRISIPQVRSFPGLRGTTEVENFSFQCLQCLQPYKLRISHSSASKDWNVQAQLSPAAYTPLWVLKGSAIHAMQREGECSCYPATNVLHPHALCKRGMWWLKLLIAKSWPACRLLDVHFIFWSLTGDTGCSYRNFRDAFHASVLGKLLPKKVPNSSWHFKMDLLAQMFL